MSDPILGLTMLGLIVAAIMMGFPTAFTLMGLGMIFGFVAYYAPGQTWADNSIFDLMVERTYGVMTNDTLLSVPLFVLMGYVIERAALVDKMFVAVQLAFRRLPASLAVSTLLVCTFWGIGSGIVGAVVVLMGVIAMRPMLNAGYDTRLAAGVITAGGTLGILIPPSVLLIVYAAVAGQSIVKLYAAAMLPGFFLALMYFVYIIGWAKLQPKIAPPLPKDHFKLDIPEGLRRLGEGRRTLLPTLFKTSFSSSADRGLALRNLLAALIPFLLALTTLAAIWWFIAIRNAAPAPEPVAATAPVVQQQSVAAEPVPSTEAEPEAFDANSAFEMQPADDAPMEAFDSDVQVSQGGLGVVPPAFYYSFGATCAVIAWLLWRYYRRMDAEQLQILKLLSTSILPLGILTFLVLAVILFGITTATESAAIGAAGAFALAACTRQLNWRKTREAVFLTAKTTAMVCWLFVGSSLFSGVFALHGGQQLIEHWVMSMNLSPLEFMLLAQAIIFILGWPLEWTEIIVIFVPIFIPLLAHFNVDPILFGVLVAVNLQAAFLSPPVAMSAFYLKGVSPPQVTLRQIFAGMMPYMLIVILCMVIMYLWPGMALWLPQFIYGS